ncbi:MAG: hypothetical protein WKF97_14530 [Chitinophagaceae bacterium]
MRTGPNFILPPGSDGITTPTDWYNNGLEFPVNNAGIKIHDLEVHELNSVWTEHSTAIKTGMKN